MEGTPHLLMRMTSPNKRSHQKARLCESLCEMMQSPLNHHCWNLKAEQTPMTFTSQGLSLATTQSMTRPSIRRGGKAIAGRCNPESLALSASTVSCCGKSSPRGSLDVLDVRLPPELCLSRGDAFVSVMQTAAHIVANMADRLQHGI